MWDPRASMRGRTDHTPHEQPGVIAWKQGSQTSAGQHQAGMVKLAACVLSGHPYGLAGPPALERQSAGSNSFNQLDVQCYCEVACMPLPPPPLVEGCACMTRRLFIVQALASHFVHPALHAPLGCDGVTAPFMLAYTCSDTHNGPRDDCGWLQWPRSRARLHSCHCTDPRPSAACSHHRKTSIAAKMVSVPTLFAPAQLMHRLQVVFPTVLAALSLTQPPQPPAVRTAGFLKSVSASGCWGGGAAGRLHRFLLCMPALAQRLVGLCQLCCRLPLLRGSSGGGAMRQHTRLRVGGGGGLQPKTNRVKQGCRSRVIALSASTLRLQAHAASGGCVVCLLSAAPPHDTPLCSECHVRVRACMLTPDAC